MKGIPEQVLLNYCKKAEIDIEELYFRLYDGEAITFDLKDGSAAFKKTATFDQITRDTFKRTVVFK
jgi:hypothetical protein